jgi:aspartyl-tRNA(Asn)/glutamyl-tRNA(Gln) amidotransferase subunit A
VRSAVEAAARTLEGLGASLGEAKLPAVHLAAGASLAVIAAEAYAYHEAWLKTRPKDYGTDVRQRLLVGAFLSAADYLKGQRVRGLARDEADRALARADVLLAPTTPIAAPPVGQDEVEIGGQRHAVRTTLIRYTRPFNLTGHPVVSVPCGFTASGLPIGLQIVGRAFDEATVLRVADAYQRATDWHLRRPPAA